MNTSAEIQRQRILKGLYTEGSMAVNECSKYLSDVGSKPYSGEEAAKLRTKELEKSGLVQKTIDEKDKRRKVVSLTEKGVDYYRKLKK